MCQTCGNCIHYVPAGKEGDCKQEKSAGTCTMHDLFDLLSDITLGVQAEDEACSDWAGYEISLHQPSVPL